MSTILRYVLVDRTGHERDHEYEDYPEACADALEASCAVLERTYTYTDSELVWTPSGGSTWPPSTRRRA